MRLRNKFIVTTIGIGIAAFLMGPMAPLGSQFWSVPEGGPEPNVVQLGLFMFYTAITCFAFGFAISYWSFGMAWTRRMFPRLTLGAHVALGYVPGSFWLHDTLHIVNGENVNGLLAIEYLFHVPMILVGLTLIAATAMGVRTRTSAPGYAATA